MYTSVVLFALSGCFTHAALIPEQPKWQTDYTLAWKQGQKESKPLAVFIGSGPGGWQLLAKERKIAKEVQDILKANYVCLYVDTSDADGKRLATAFKVSDGPGLVISDRTGELQAFRHAGELSGAELQRYLSRYADPNRVARTTETREETRSYAPTYQQPSYVPSGGFGGGRSC